MGDIKSQHTHIFYLYLYAGDTSFQVEYLDFLKET